MIHLHHSVLLRLAGTLPLNKVSADSMRAFAPTQAGGWATSKVPRPGLKPALLQVTKEISQAAPMSITPCSMHSACFSPPPGSWLCGLARTGPLSQAESGAAEGCSARQQWCPGAGFGHGWCTVPAGSGQG